MQRSSQPGQPRFSPRARDAARTRRAALVRPRLEVLEDRMAPAVLTVNTLADNTTDTSVLTLRDAVILVNHGGDPASLGQSSMPAGWAAQINTTTGAFGSHDTIQFARALIGAPSATITLTHGQLDVTQGYRGARRQPAYR